MVVGDFASLAAPNAPIRRLAARSVRCSARCSCRSAIRWSRAGCRGRRTGLRVVTKRQPTPAEWQAMRFAWRVMAHVKSNTVIFTDAVRTLAIGAGQMSRVDAVKVAVAKASALERHTVAAEGQRRRLGRVLPVPRRPGCGRGCRRHRGRAAGRVGEGCRSDCGGRRARSGDGVHRQAHFGTEESRSHEINRQAERSSHLCLRVFVRRVFDTKRAVHRHTVAAPNLPTTRRRPRWPAARAFGALRAGGQGQRQRRDHGVARAGHVRHLPGRWPAASPPRRRRQPHAAFAERDQHAAARRRALTMALAPPRGHRRACGCAGRKRPPPRRDSASPAWRRDRNPGAAPWDPPAAGCRARGRTPPGAPSPAA